MPSNNILNVYQGRTPLISFVLPNEDLTIDPNNPVLQDITGYTLYFTVKLNRDDTDTNAIISYKIQPVSVSGQTDTTGKSYNPSNPGISLPQAQIRLTGIDTGHSVGRYYWDILYVDPSGNSDNTHMGQFNILLPIRQIAT